MMDIHKLSDMMLLLVYSDNIKQSDQLYAQRKEIEKEIASRNESLRQRYQDGKINLERDDLENE